MSENPPPPSLSRREMLGAVATAGLGAAEQAKNPTSAKPNILIVIADQVRWDFVGAYGRNPMDVTPNLDTMATRGSLFHNMFANHPVCSPSRASLFTGQYETKHGVWRNTGDGVALAPTAITLASVLGQNGYSTNYIGKWHLAGTRGGPVASKERGDFLNLWEAANELELTSHPYEGDLFDGDGRPIHFQNQYRVDFMTGLAKNFLRGTSKTSPFLLVVSYLEPHQQNDQGRMVAPLGYADRYQNPFVPEDLRRFPGDWQQQLPDYYGCLKKIDEAVGEIQQTLVDTGLDKNTIMLFVSDHGCHFMTRNSEYKRSAHDASIHIPLIIDGPGFRGGHTIRQSVSMVDITPTLLQTVGVSTPRVMQGTSVLGLLAGTGNSWPNEVFVQLSEYWVGRALRTPEWTYVTAAPRSTAPFKPAPNAPHYACFQVYDNRADPHQLVNLAGRKEVANISSYLEKRLRQRMQEVGDFPSEFDPCPFPYS